MLAGRELRRRYLSGEIDLRHALERDERERARQRQADAQEELEKGNAAQALESARIAEGLLRALDTAELSRQPSEEREHQQLRRLDPRHNHG